MTKFGDRFQGGRRRILAKFGETVSYTAYGQSAADITAAWTPGEEQPDYFEDGQFFMRRGSLYCSTDDVSSPDRRDSVTISGESWEVESYQPDNAGGITLMLVRKERIEVSGPEHRIRR